jgi:Zn-dependent protease
MDIGAPPQADDPSAPSPLAADVVATHADPERAKPAAPTPGNTASTAGMAARVFYRLDYRKVTFAEYWKENPSGIVGHGIRKLLRAHLACSADDPCVESLAPFEVPRTAVPGMIAQRFSVPMSQLSALGFREPIWHRIEDDVQRTTHNLVTMTHESGRMWARVHNRIWHVRTPAKSTIFCEIVSELAGGRFIWSVSAKPELDAPPACTLVRLVGATPNQLLAAHQNALADSGAGKPLPVHSTADLRESLERLHAAVRGFHVARGVFAPLSAQDEETAEQFRDGVQSASESGSRYPEILAEISNLQNKKASRTNGLILLAASIVLFFGAGLTKMGPMRFSADYLVILVGVLFVHETGHWVAMRAFGYRNLKMFFIPFFGAAVSGRHYNVAGWKKVIVSLMGPVPGIVGGAACGAAGVYLHSALLTKIALVAIIMNGFNLLPLLPLDGGWVVHAILFSRHHLLELGFRVAALGALFVLAMASSDNVLLGVAIAMSISLPAMYKVAKITSALRRSSLSLRSDDGQTLPPAAAEIIVERIKSAFPAKLSNKAAAQYTLQVFENLNAVPPRALASIALGLLHFGSMVGAGVAAMLIYVGVSNGTWHKLDASAMRVVRPQSDSALAEPRNTVFAIYDSPSAARAALGDLQRTASAESAVGSLGDMAVLSLPFEDVDGLRDVQTSLERKGTTFVISSPTAPALIRMSCTAKSPVAAKSIDRELGDYFDADVKYLLPPWQLASPWTTEERAHYARARHTLRRLSDDQRALMMDSGLVELRMRLYSARRNDERATVARLGAELQQRSARLSQERVQAMRVARDVDTAVVDAFAQVVARSPARDESEEVDAASAPAELAPLLGTVPLANGVPAAGTLDLSATGAFMANKLAITMPSLHFANAFQGPPALARWLLANGCSELKYSVASGIGATTGRDARARTIAP